MYLRRAGDAPLREFSIQLGCCTWFNEPILRSLTILAPILETLVLEMERSRPALEAEALRRSGNVSSTSPHGNKIQPPVQVLCLTDGLDNVSPPGVSGFDG